MSHFIIYALDTDAELLRKQYEHINVLDRHIVYADTFTLDHAREIKKFFSTASYGGKVAYITSQKITEEAQNSLLKVTEEMISGNMILLVTDIHLLLPTVISRGVLGVVEKEHSIKQNSRQVSEVLDFFELTIPKRLKKVQKIATAKNVADAKKLVDDCVYVVRNAQHEAFLGKQKTVLLKDLLELRSFLDLQGASIKLILESLSLILPTCTISQI